MLDEKDYLYDDYANDYVSFNDMTENINRNIEGALGRKKKETEVKIIDMDKTMENDLKNNNGFIITDKEGLDKSNTERLENGIYSPKYGSIWGDENAFEELYSCDCKKYKGRKNKDKFCEDCKSYVIYRGKNISYTGWFKLNNYKIIHPNIYYKIGSLIGYKRLKEILTPEWITDVTGVPQKPIIDEKTRNDKKYDHIGILEFQKRFDEIIDFFYSKRKHKKDVYDFIKKNRNKVFVSCLPCMQLFLRPIVLGDEDFNFAKINPKYAALSTKFYNINNKEYTEKDEKTLVNRLYSIQKTYFFICDMIMDMLNKKEGHIRNDILGFRTNYCIRAVIGSLPGTKIDEIHFPYLGFLEMYRPEILNTLCKLRNITIGQAYMRWKKAQVRFDKTIYRIMCYIVENYDCSILLNRNPTLNLGGIQQLRIVKVKPVYDDLTIDIPINVITAYGADFDGDQMNGFGLKDAYLKKAYRTPFNPRENLIISKNDGLFNDEFNLIKDQLICLHYFNTLGNNKIEILEYPEGYEEKHKKKDDNNNKEKKKMKKIKIRRIKES